MPNIGRFRLVKTVGNDTSRASVEVYDPADEPGEFLTGAYSILGVTMTLSGGGEEVATLKSGYMRGLGSDDMDGWEPATGALLWAGAAGKPTTTRPAKGPVVFIGTYMGSGMVDVNVRVVPGLDEASFVKREALAEYDVMIWDATEEAFVPRQIVHGEDLAGLENEDDHPMYAPMRWSEMLDDSGFSPDGNGEFTEVPEKATREDDDLLLLEDSGGAFTKKRVTASSLIAVHTTTVTGTSHTASVAHAILVDDDTAGSTVTVTLPPAASCDRPYHVKKLGSTANVVIDGDGSELIDGALSQTITAQYDSLTLVSDGAAWWTI